MKTQIPRVDTVPLDVEAPTPLGDCWLAGDHGAIALRGLPRGETARSRRTGEEKFTTPDQKSFRHSLTHTTRERKRRPAGSMPTSKVWKPQPSWLVADWPMLMEPERGESCLSVQRRGAATPGDDRVSSPD